MSTDAFKRNRWPMGGRAVFVLDDASCRAGHTCFFWVRLAVKRNACLISPDATSSYVTSPGRIGSPAASADVHVSGRSAFDLRSNTAPESAFQLPSTSGN